MSRFKTLYQSTIGKKFIAAVTGLILFLFLVGHVAGNLKVFTGTTAEQVPHIDEYGHFLRVMGEPMIPAGVGIWATRIVLLVSLVLHVLVVSQLALLSAEARPVRYAKSKKVAATVPALGMMGSGVLLLAFVVFHILHLTTGSLPVSEFEHGYVFNNLWYSFYQNPVLVVVYIAAMLVIGLHLYHGVWSLFQTLGLDNPDRNQALRMFAMVGTALLVIAFCSVPIAFALGCFNGPVEYNPDLLSSH